MKNNKTNKFRLNTPEIELRMTDVEMKRQCQWIKLDLHESGISMKALNTCAKAQFIRNRAGEVVIVLATALHANIVKSVQESEKTSNKIGIQIILDVPKMGVISVG